MFEQPNLGFDPTIAGIAPKAIGPQHSMARDKDRDRIAPAGLPDRLCGYTQLRRQIAIGPRLAKGNRGHGRTHTALKLRTGQTDRQGEVLPFPCEIL